MAQVWKKVWNAKLWELARRNRKHPTEAESLLWDMLREKHCGFKFRRQQIIGNYIADFVCVEKGLVIEVDGGYHNSAEQQTDDQLRTEFLESEGFQVMRFTNEEIIFNGNEVLAKIKRYLIKELI